MLRINLLLLTVILLVISAPLTSNSQQRGRKSGPVKRGAVPPPPKEVVPVKAPYNWNPVFTGQISSLYKGKAGSDVFAVTNSSLYRSDNYGKDWTLVFSPPLNLPMPQTMYPVPNYGWKLIFQQSKPDPQVMYLSAIGHTNNLTTNFYASSFWKSVNGGRDWQHVNDNTYASGSMPFDPRYKTGQGSVASSLEISPKTSNTVFMVGIEGRLYKSLNGGTSWTDITPANISPFRIKINPHDAENMYLLDGQRSPLETTDSGSTWHEMKYDLSLLDTGSFGYSPDTDRRWTWLGFQPNMPARLLGIVNSHLVTSDDGGKTWRDISFVTETYRYRPGLLSEPTEGHKIASINALDFSGTGTDTLYISTDSGVYKSTDFGKAWTFLLQEPAFDFVVSNDDKEILAATKLGTFQASKDFSKWTTVGQSLSSVATPELSAIGGFDSPLYVIKANGDLLKSSNSFDWEWERNPFKGITYRKGYNKADFKVIQFFKTLDGTSYTLAAYEVHRKLIKETSDKNREEIKLPVVQVDWCDCRIALSKADSQKIYLYSDKSLFVSDNGGANWEESINNGVKVVVVSPQSSSTAYAVLAGNTNALNSVLTTTDGGKTWRAGASSLQDVAITLGLTESFWSVTVDPKNPNVAYVTSKNAVFRTSDSGQTWILVTRNRFNAEIYDVTFEQGSGATIYLATSNGVWRSSDSGKNWNLFSDGIPIYRIISTEEFTIAFGKGIIYRLGKSSNGNGANPSIENSPSAAPIEKPNRDLPSKRILRVTQGEFTINRECDGGACHFEIVSFNFGPRLTISVGRGDSSLSYYFSVEITEGKISKDYVFSDESNEHFVEKLSKQEVNATLNKLLLDVYNLGKYVVDSNMAIRNRKFSPTGRFAALANLGRGLE